MDRKNKGERDVGCHFSNTAVFPPQHTSLAPFPSVSGALPTQGLGVLLSGAARRWWAGRCMLLTSCPPPMLPLLSTGAPEPWGKGSFCVLALSPVKHGHETPLFLQNPEHELHGDCAGGWLGSGTNVAPDRPLKPDLCHRRQCRLGQVSGHDTKMTRCVIWRRYTTTPSFRSKKK
jgi:hypothetical protein